MPNSESKPKEVQPREPQEVEPLKNLKSKVSQFISLAEATQGSPYSQEYLSLLARKGKLFSKKIGRNWFTTQKAIQHYLAQQGLTIIIPKTETSPFSRTKIKRPIIVGAEAFFPTWNHLEVEPPSGGSTSEIKTQPSEKDEEVLPIKVLNQEIVSQEAEPLLGGSASQKLEEALNKISENLGALSQLQKIQLERQPQQAPIIFQQASAELPPEHKEFYEIESQSLGHKFRKLNYLAGRSFKNPRRTVGIMVAALVLLFLIGGGFSFGNVDAVALRVKDFFKDADSIQGHFAGTHANEVLLLDKEGKVSIYGHIETQGQLRSFAPDGVAPIVVDSMTLVENLNAEYLDGLASKDFTLAFVTKNGNITYEDVYLEGNVEVGKTLTVKGAVKLLDSLLVYGKLGVFSEAVFGKDVQLTNGNLKIDKGIIEVVQGNVNITRGNLKLGQGTIEINNRTTVRNLNAELLQGYRPSDFTLDFVVENGNETNNIAFFNGGIYGGDGAFSSLGVSGDVSVGDENDKDNFVTIFSKKFSVDKSGNLTASGTIAGSRLSTGKVVSDLVPSGSYDLGSSARPWDELIVSSVSIGNLTLTGSADISGTTSSSFRINTDNTSSDSEDSYLAFERGTITPNASLLWNAASKQFEFNQPVKIASSSVVTLSVSGGAASISNSLFVQNGGNVGIGTTSPTTKLDVIGNASISLNFEIGANLYRFISTGASWSVPFETTSYASASYIYAQPGTTSSPSFSFGNDKDTGLFRKAADSISITAGGAEQLNLTSTTASISNALYIDSSNQVGIGTTTPGAQFVVAGSTILPQYLYSTNTQGTGLGLQNLNATTQWNVAVGGGITWTANQFLIDESGVGVRLAINPGGNVGIGTTSPTTKLDVIGAASVSGNFELGGFPNVGTTHVCRNATSQLLGNCASSAEYVPGDGTLTEGDIISIDTSTSNPFGDKKAPFITVRSKVANDPKLLGVITNFYDGASGNKLNDNYVPLGVYGYFPVKVNLENGPIKRGNYLTSSSVPGVAMKQAAAGPSIGIALEPLDAVSSGSYSKIQVFVNGRSYYGGELFSGGQMAMTGSVSSQFSGLLDVARVGSGVEISHASGFDMLTFKAVKQLVFDAPVSIFKNIKAEGDVIAEGIKKTYYSVANLWPNVDVGIMVANWGTRDIMISNDADSSVFAMFSGNGAQAAEQSKTDLAENGAYLATYGVDSTRGEIQLSGSSDLVGGEAKVYFDYSFTSLISDTAPIKILVTPTTNTIRGQLYVATKTSYGFVAQELNGLSDGKFDWLVIARRKGYEGADGAVTNLGTSDVVPTSDVGGIVGGMVSGSPSPVVSEVEPPQEVQHPAESPTPLEPATASGSLPLTGQAPEPSPEPTPEPTVSQEVEPLQEVQHPAESPTPLEPATASGSLPLTGQAPEQEGGQL